MKAEFAAILETLVRREVEFVVVGGLALNLRGARISTEDVDVVANLGSANVERLSAALEELDARYLDFAGRLIRPEPRRLLENRVNLIETRAGRIDILKTIGQGRDFAALLALSDEMEVAGLILRVASVDALIEAKEVAGREKDKFHLHLLRELRRLEKARDANAGATEPQE